MAEPVTLRPCPALWQASVPAEGAASAIRRLASALGAAPPAPGRTLETAEGLLWRGAPRRWRMRAEAAGAPAPEAFAALDGAALSDLGPGLAIIGLHGETAEALAARAVTLDLRAAAFPSGAAATTVHRHATVTLLRVAEGFEMLAPRSLAEDFAERLAGIAARLG
ncbi:hypothetical protein P2H44_13035 [Albimonas sp. CAU 1670]|uniref:hypothetical protein n=1 Tax=Albimonas sp. CAU 1670 TaxID=3032599 RepID=UPI0023DA0A29|nr:hypothetical protein [Albimonas sp. CAU 1670]MDF2233478.1 hypothetical protein [Albimonas sp. CAU 1670]